MSRKRDIIEEIESKNHRGDYSDKSQVVNRISQIEDLISQLKESPLSNNTEILRYFPIAIITTTESFFRYLYKELIDSNDIFLQNAITYVKSLNNFKFDIDYLSALNGKRVTVGDIISHLIQLNNLDDINKTLSKLLDIDFLEQVKKFDYSDAFPGISKGEINKNFGSIIKSVNDNYEIRHILSHEFASNINLIKEKIFLDFENHKYFLEASNFVVEHMTGNYVPWYQQGMNKWAYEKYMKSKAELESLIILLKKINTDKNYPSLLGDLTLFNKAIKNWETYRDNYAESFAVYGKGGTIYPTIYYSVMNQQTQFFIQNLRDEHQIALKRYST